MRELVADDKNSFRFGYSGFSLLEVLVAIAILSVGILATASMQGAASRSNVIADTRTEATTLAADRIEKLAALPLTGNPDEDPSDLVDTDSDGQAGLGDIGGDADHMVAAGQYTVYWNVADNVPITDTKTVRVIVTWRMYGGQARVIMERVIPRII